MAFVRSPATKTALLAEITTDPCALGLSVGGVPISAPQMIADLLNAPKVDRLNWADGRVSTVKRTDISAAELLENIDVRDTVAAPAQVPSVTLAASWFESVTQAARLRLTNEDNTNTRIRANLNRLFGDTQGTQTRIGTLAIREGSRAEALFGREVTLTDKDVSWAQGFE